MGHTPFSSNDDRHLVEYLTTHNPDGKGRRGNAIYQQLTSDTGRWPWSKRHPWQSWRDRYVKNDALMEKKIKVYRKNMVINDKEDAKQLSTKKADAVLGSCSGEQASNKKRERESLGSRVDASKRQKVADEQVNMERRCSVSGSSKNNAEPGTDMAREDGAEDEAGRKVAGSYVSLANEPESKPSHKLDEQSIERLRLMDNHDDDNEERQEVNEILVNVAGSGSIISEDQNTVRRASDASLRPPSVTRIEAATANSPVPHSDGSFNSLFDSDSSEHGSDSEKELNKASRKMAKSYQLPQRDDFFRSSPETDAALANGCDRPSAHKVKMAARRHPPTLVEGPFISTFVKTSQRISGNDGNESTDSSLPPNSPIKKTNLPTDDRRRLPVQDAMAASAEVFRERDDDGRTNAWPPSRKTLRAPSLTKETQEKQSGQAVEVLTQKVEKKPDNKTQRSLHRNDDMDSGQLVEKHERQHSNRQLGRVLGVESLPRSLKSLPETPGHVVATKSKMPPVDSVSISGDSHHFKLQPMCSEDKLIDLREERRRMAILRQSAGSSRSGSVAANHSISYGTRQSPSFSLHLSSQDQSFVASLGIQQAITMMSNNHGFTETVVSRILQTVNNIAKADEILRLMRVRAEEEATIQLTANMTDSSDSISASRPKSVSKKRQPRISKLSDDEHLPDYSPSSKTRAGRFTRLVEQGRYTEADTREARRASGTISPFKLASNTSDRSNSAANNSPSRNGLSPGIPPDAEENVFSDNRKEESEKVTADVRELFDAHAAVMDDLKEKEDNLDFQQSFHRFQQAAMFLKEVLTSQRS